MQRFLGVCATIPVALALRPAIARSNPVATTKRHLGALMDLMGGGDSGLISPDKALPGCCGGDVRPHFPVGDWAGDGHVLHISYTDGVWRQLGRAVL